ncbi:5-oxoprolinase subunit PxpB [Marinomonas communis]|uniref:KipI family sensor histidine kinase inhibitor n=1 Tax=Marinomonas communis TaxID=28254 RepID=A0A4R6WYF4_9GAMM|nr:5-oxoprolinase subunit PxpB [Marinomonas communis]MCC4274109.1 5-oxoprolinase subunit PxpB [Marinomonas communis]TDR06281.1 KipI family sensor histidine kinase inhibitor [Marinomonas communis]
MKDNQASAATATPIEISLVSDQACLLQFSNVISDAVADQISLVTTALRELEGIIDLIPSYTTLLVVFDTSCFDRFAIQKALQGVLASIDWSSAGNRVSQEVVIPVYYGPEVGPDLEDVAKHCQLDTDEVIRLHSTTTYRAYAIGFTPGFAFLGNTPEALHVPRKTTPRLKVPIGSVAIAERQTAVYPSVTPGGWQILGRTPIALVNWASDSLALINAGDSVRFEPMTKEEFLAQGGNLDGF